MNCSCFQCAKGNVQESSLTWHGLRVSTEGPVTSTSVHQLLDKKVTPYFLSFGQTLADVRTHDPLHMKQPNCATVVIGLNMVLS